MSKLTKILLFSGGSDSVLISHLYHPDYLVYINMHTRYSDEEIKKIKESSFGSDPRLEIIDFPFLGQYERDDAIIPYRNAFLPLIIATHFISKGITNIDICLGATAGDRICDKGYPFVESFNKMMETINIPQHWLPEGAVVKLNIEYKKYTKTEMLKLYKDQGGDINKLMYESFSCYDPIDGKECWCKNGICKPCFRKYIAYKLNGAEFSSDVDISVCEAIKAEILPQIKAGTYGRAEEEKDVLKILEIYEKEHPENIGKLIYKDLNHRHQ